ncbi:Uncharacterised protein [Mycobacteroides abscessus subsp. abscessus]|nr:Uncharacterised protein [Mycobacteroides abscessus subsp. abscessus]
MPATSTPTLPTASASTSMYAPRTAIDSLESARSSSIIATLTARPISATTTSVSPGTSGSEPMRRIASYRTKTATPISRTALATAVKTSARCHPKLRSAVVDPWRASKSATRPIRSATTSVNMCPASAINASELTAIPTPSSTKKYVPIIATATTIGQMRRFDVAAPVPCECVCVCE